MTSTQKAMWQTPKLEQLDVNRTLGGTQSAFFESQPTTDGTDRGSIPDPS